MLQPSDRRTQERRRLRVTAQVVASPTQVAEVRTIDISTDGIGIVAPVNPRAGVVFLIRFKMPQRPTGCIAIETKVKVIHSVFGGDEEGFKIGLNYVALSSAHERAIQNYCE